MTKHTIIQFSEAKDLWEIPTGSLPTMATNKCEMRKKCDSQRETRYITETLQDRL